MSKKPLVYVASPYSHHEESIRNQRYDEVTKVVAKLCDLDVFTIPPITFNVPLAPYIASKDTTWEYWKEYDKRLIDACDELWIVMIPGWQDSIGVRAESKYAMSKNMTIRLLSPEYMFWYTVPYFNLLNHFNVDSVEELND